MDATSCRVRAWDGWLNDVGKFVVEPAHIIKGIESVTSDAVSEGNTGGGTAMICHRFKGGTGSSSRLIVAESDNTTYTVAALVQANYGSQETLRIGGVPIGRLLAQEYDSGDSVERKKDGSNNHNHSHRCTFTSSSTPTLGKESDCRSRLELEVMVIMDQEIYSWPSVQLTAFLYWQDIDDCSPKSNSIEVLDDETIDSVFHAAADATEEAIYNALCSAETMVGRKGRNIVALPLERVKAVDGEKYFMTQPQSVPLPCAVAGAAM